MKRSGNDRTLTRRSFLGSAALASAGLAAAGKARSAGSRGRAATGRRVCVFTKHLQWFDYGTAAEIAAEIGFDGVDIPVRPGGHVLPERVAEDLPRAVEAFRGAGLDVPMITTAITGTDSPYAEEVIRTAAGLGIGYYRMGWLRYDDSLGIEKTLDSYRPRFRELAVMNAEYGVHGAYQNHAGVNVGAPVWDIWYLIRDLDPRWMGCQYDIRHATVEGGNSWRLGLRLIGRFVRTTVVKDFKWDFVDGKWRVVNTPVGEGMVDFKAYYELVGTLGIDGPISMHFEYPHGRTRKDVVSVMRKDVRALRSFLAEAGLGG